jgi:GntR family transcriptional regulator, colanic acid and biofilm gene transcriptional regulator
VGIPKSRNRRYCDHKIIASGIMLGSAMDYADAVPLDEQAYRSLRHALVEGTFAPGDKLSIRRVAAALGTSAMPARTALRRLASEQALDLMPSGTAVVPRLTRAAFTELSAVRAELEPLALRLAAPHMGAPLFGVLADLVASGHAALAAGDAPAFLQADREFLFTIYRAAAAPMLLGIIEALWLRRGPLFWEARWVLLSRRDVRERHHEILQALRAGQAEQASAELRSEIESASGFLLNQVPFADDGSSRGRLDALNPVGGRTRA